MEIIEVTDATAQYIKRIRSEELEERKAFLCNAYTKAVEHALANDEYSESDFYPLTVIHDYHKLIEELAEDDDESAHKSNKNT